MDRAKWQAHGLLLLNNSGRRRKLEGAEIVVVHVEVNDGTTLINAFLCHASAYC